MLSLRIMTDLGYLHFARSRVGRVPHGKVVSLVVDLSNARVAIIATIQE